MILMVNLLRNKEGKEGREEEEGRKGRRLPAMGYYG